MTALLDAWSKEIAAAAEAAAERKHQAAGQEAERRADQAAQVRRDISAQLAADLQERSSVEARLYNQVQQAQAGYDISISVPEGVSVASTLIVAANDAELFSMFTELKDADDHQVRDAQHSAAWAMQHGLVPHPKDLGTIASHFEGDRDWGQRFADLGARLDALVTPAKSHARIQADLGGARLDLVKSTVAALGDYGPARAATLVKAPQTLGTLGAAPTVPGKAPGMDRAQLRRVLDTLPFV